MTKNEATERANAIWPGKALSIIMESIGSGCYVTVGGDDRWHRLDWHGHIRCREHSDCLKLEAVADGLACEICGEPAGEGGALCPACQANA